jgi:hypothetical protein
MTFSHCQFQDLKGKGIYLQMTGNIFSSQPWNIHQVEYLFGANFCQTDTICHGSVQAKIKMTAIWLRNTERQGKLVHPLHTIRMGVLPIWSLDYQNSQFTPSNTKMMSM